MQTETHVKQPQKPIGKVNKEKSTEATKGTLTGEVCWFSGGKGFGFLSRDDGEEDIFVHFSSVVMDGYRTLKQGQRVRFTTGNGPKGIQAENVEVLED